MHEATVSPSASFYIPSLYLAWAVVVDGTDEDLRAQWSSLALGYTESQGTFCTSFTSLCCSKTRKKTQEMHKAHESVLQRVSYTLDALPCVSLHVLATHMFTWLLLLPSASECPCSCAW